MQETFSNILSAAVRQELRAVTCLGSQTAAKLAFAYKKLFATNFNMKNIKTESSRMRGKQKGKVTSGFWENLIQINVD